MMFDIKRETQNVHLLAQLKIAEIHDMKCIILVQKHMKTYVNLSFNTHNEIHSFKTMKTHMILPLKTHHEIYSFKTT